MQRLICWLLYLANTSPPVDRREFYVVKRWLLLKYARFAGHQLQEIRKECWGPWDYDLDGRTGCPGKGCSHCGGTGIFDLRWVRLARWEWCGRVFHVPLDDSRVIPSPYPPANMIRGRIEHKHYGRLAREAALWLYLLTGWWRLFWRALSGSRSCGWYAWPLLNVQRIVMELSLHLRWRKCWCGRWFPTWGTGWQVCGQCRRTTRTSEIPF